MAMRDTLHRWTREAVLALPADGMRHELFDGELVVTPAPFKPHQLVVGELFLQLAGYLAQHAAGKALLAPADLPLLGGQVAQPDVFVLPHLEFAGDWHDAPVPLLAIEVVSPSSARFDRGLKRRAYQQAGVAEYWIVDPEAQIVERWRPSDDRPEVLHDVLTWQPRPDVQAMSFDIRSLFRDT